MNKVTVTMRTVLPSFLPMYFECNLHCSPFLNKINLLVEMQTRDSSVSTLRIAVLPRDVLK